jgi:hypothetical protein
VKHIRHRALVSAAAVLWLVLALSLPATGRSPEPSPLARERTTNGSRSWKSIFGADPAALCHPTKESTFPFEIHGLAEGPYPGTFRTRGTITVGRHDQEAINRFGVVGTAGRVRVWRAHFTILSGNTTITGRLRLDPSVPGSLGECGSFADAADTQSPGWRFTGFDLFITAGITYRATISSPEGDRQVSGRASAEVGVGRVTVTGCPHPTPLGCVGESSWYGGGVIYR